MSKIQLGFVLGGGPVAVSFNADDNTNVFSVQFDSDAESDEDECASLQGFAPDVVGQTSSTSTSSKDSQQYSLKSQASEQCHTLEEARNSLKSTCKELRKNMADQIKAFSSLSEEAEKRLFQVWTRGEEYLFEIVELVSQLDMAIKDSRSVASITETAKLLRRKAACDSYVQYLEHLLQTGQNELNQLMAQKRTLEEEGKKLQAVGGAMSTSSKNLLATKQKKKALCQKLETEIESELKSIAALQAQAEANKLALAELESENAKEEEDEVPLKLASVKQEIHQSELAYRQLQVEISELEKRVNALQETAGDEVGDYNECPYCLDVLVYGENECVLKPCNHVFCVSCFKTHIEGFKKRCLSHCCDVTIVGAKAPGFQCEISAKTRQVKIIKGSLSL